MEKQIWTTIAVSLIVAVISSVVTVAVINNNVEPQLSPGQAASCDRDDVCETNAVEASDWLKSDALLLYTLKPENKYGALSVDGDDLLLEAYQELGDIIISPHEGRNTQIHGSVRLEDLDDGDTSMEFLCIGIKGELFLSETPCA